MLKLLLFIHLFIFERFFNDINTTAEIKFILFYYSLEWFGMGFYPYPCFGTSCQLFNMASACAMGWVPDSLFNMAVSAIVTSYSRHRRDLKSLPERVQFDIYYKVG